MRKPSRREFALTAASLPFIASTEVAHGQVPPPSTPAEPPAAPAVDALASAKTATLRAEFGEHLSPADLEQLENEISESLPWLRRMREFPLDNADEPDFAFAAWDER